METRVVQPDEESLANTARLLRDHALVAFPTETVYGLGADARCDDAVRNIYEAKGRPPGNPIIVHVADIAAARACAATGGWSDRAEALARQFWPGPLTIIVPRGAGLSALVSAGGTTVGLRMPDHPVVAGLLAAFGGPIAAPSANRSGFTSPTTAAHVLAELDGRVPLILDGGACAVGVESTVVDVTGPVARILRPGAVTAEMLRDVVGSVEDVQAIVPAEATAESPGQHSRHYAPRTPAYRFALHEWESVRRHISGKAALLSWTDAVHLPAPHETLRLSGDAAAYARVMYAAMHAADDKQVAAIWVLMPADATGLWAAIADRLTRATKRFSHADA